MAQRILVIDTDAEFTGVLKAGFGALGVSVEVVEDGDVGVDRATAERPDLILLAIELRGVNGFLVCKKIKKSNDLKDIPLVILSSEASDEIFEQHGKLRTRAEDYLHKPVAFEVLLERVRRLVPIGGDGEPVDEEVVSIVDVDEQILDADLEAEQVAEPERSRAGVDADIDAFAENAFGNLMMENEATSIGALPEALARDLAARQVPHAPAAPPEEELTHDIATEPPPPPEPAPAKASASSAESVAELAALRQEVESLRQSARRAEEHEQAARRGAGEIARLEREVADLKARMAKGGGGGVSSREFLDLREGLNRKDKEILELRDQVTTRDRQALDANDRGLALERKIADLEDRAGTTERSLEEAHAKHHSLVADNEQLQKRSDDVKARLERAELKAKKLETDLEAERAAQAKAADEAKAHAAAELERASAAAQNALDAARAAAAAELEHVKEQLGGELAAAKTTATNDVAAAKAAAAAELAAATEAHDTAAKRAAAEHAAAAEAAKKAHEEALAASAASHDAALAHARAEAAVARDVALAELRGELEAAHTAALAEATAASAAALGAAQTEREAELAQAKSDHEAALAQALSQAHDEQGRELAVLGRKLAEAEASLATTAEALESSVESGLAVQQNLDARTKELTEARTELAATRARRDELDGAVRTHVARIAELEEAKSDLETKLVHALAKADGDALLLERVRKALAIAGALLDEQQRGPRDAE
jgi:CheY-like chemotaxis protein